MQDSHSCDPGSIPGQCTFFFFFFLLTFTPLVFVLISPLLLIAILISFSFFQSILAPITDLHYRHQADDYSKSLSRDEHPAQVEASKMAIVAMLKSWPGVFSLCNPHGSGLMSLLSMLSLAKPPVQREILEILYSVFQLKVPEWTDNFKNAVSSIGKCVSNMDYG